MFFIQKRNYFKHVIWLYEEEDNRIAFITSCKIQELFDNIPQSLIKSAKNLDIDIIEVITDDFLEESIVKKDPFFEGVVFYRDTNRFVKGLERLING